LSRTGIAEHVAKDELQSTEGDLEGWQDVLRTAIRLAGNCHAAYLKARPSRTATLQRRRPRDRLHQGSQDRPGRVRRGLRPLFSRPSSN